MFKSGDRIKYVIDGKYNDMTLNNIYVVIDAYYELDKEYVRILDDSKINIKTLFSYRFEHCIREERKLKLEKLKTV